MPDTNDNALLFHSVYIIIRSCYF